MDSQLHEKGMTRVFCKYIIRNGRRIYPKNAKVFTFLVRNQKGR